MNVAAILQHNQHASPIGQLLALLCWTAAAILCYKAWRRRRGRDAVNPIIVAGVGWTVRLFLLAAGPRISEGGYAWLTAALDISGLTLFAWPFLAPPLSFRWADRLAGLGLSLVALACGGFLWQWIRDGLGLPPLQPYPVISWGHSLLTLAALLALHLLRRPARRALWILPAVALGLGLAGVALSPSAPSGTISALTAITVALATLALNRLGCVSSEEMQALSSEAPSPGPWRPSQWLEASTALFVAPDLPQLLKAATAALTYIVDVRLAGLILAEEEPPLRLRLVARYPQTEGVGITTPFTPDSCPAIGNALASGQIANIDRESNLALVEPLDRILGTIVRAALILPLLSEPEVNGVLTLVRDHKALDTEQLYLCSKLADQVAVAVGHVRLRFKVIEQAHSLAHLVRRHQQETGRLVAILESISEGVIVSDADDKIFLVNKAALAILNKAREEIVGRPFGQIINRTIRVGDASAIGVVTEAPSHSMEAIFEIAGRAVQTSMAPVRANGGTQLGVVALLRDVTERIRTEAKREQELARLREQNRRLAEAAEHLRELVWSGDVALNPTRFDLQEVIEEAAARVVPLIRNKPVTIVRAREFGLPAIRADRARIRQVLFNLLSNAARYMKEGQIAISASRGKDYIVASIAHIGSEVSPQYVEALCEEFGRANGGASRPVDGLRLGLSVSRRLIELHGGKTWVRKGKVIILYLGLPIHSPR